MQHGFPAWEFFTTPHLKPRNTPHMPVGRAEKWPCCKMFLSSPQPLTASISSTVFSLLPYSQRPWFISTLFVLIQFHPTVSNYWYKTGKNLLLGLPRDQSSIDTSGSLKHPLEKKKNNNKKPKHAWSLNHWSYKFQIIVFTKHFSHWHKATWGKCF